MPALSTLPVEVIETIACTLDRPSIFAVRLTCKKFHQKTLHYFRHTYFDTVQTDLSHNSLQKLQSISQSEEFKYCVQTLLIKKWDHGLGQGLYWHRAEAWAPSNSVVDLASPGVQILREIVTTLVNCKSFRIHSFGGMEEEYKPWYLLPSDAANIILGLVAILGLPIKAFHLDFSSLESVDASRVQMKPFQHLDFASAWKNLEDLRLEYHLTPDIFDWSRNLVLQTTRLRKLSLKFNFDHSISFLDSLLHSPTPFQRLQELKLGYLHITLDALSALLLHCRSTLCRLSLCHIYIQSGTWVQVLTDLKTFQLLEEVAVDWLAENRNEEILRIQFPALDENAELSGSGSRNFELKYKKWKGKRTIIGVSFNGRLGMDNFLDILVESAEYL